MMHTRRALLSLVAVLAMGCTSNVPPSSSPPPASPALTTVAPATASPFSSPSVVPTAAPSPTASAAALPLTLSVPKDAVHMLPTEDPSAIYGSREFATIAHGKPARLTLVMRDLATGKTLILGKLSRGHTVAQMAATADRVIWVETWRDHPSPPSNAVPGCADAGKPLRWQVVSLLIDTRQMSPVATGKNTRTAVGGECADVNPPVIAADGDRVAFSLEATSSAHPAGNRIVVRSLTDGRTIRTVTSTGLVRDLVLDGQAMAYRDNAIVDGGGSTVDPFNGRLMVVTDDTTAPASVDDHVLAASLGGGRIAWAREDATDGSIWTSTLGSDLRLQVTGFAAPDFTTDRVIQIATRGNLVTWVVSGHEASTQVNTSRLAAWVNGDPSARLVDGFNEPDFVGISGGWLVWDATLNDPGGTWQAGLYGIPITDLPAP